MKLTIAGFEVDIKAKAKYNDRFNKTDTEDFLNRLSLLLGHSETGDKFFESEANKASFAIYDALDNLGVYNKYRR